MKTKLFLVLLFISSYTFAQNWSQVGATQFSSNFVINAEFAFNNTGTPFVVYEVPSNNGIYVEKFDGTNWVQVGSGEISTENYNNITIKINPVTNEPWVVLKSASGGVNSNLDIYSFDGSSWVSEGQNVGGGLYSNGVQIQFNASGNPRIAGIVSGGPSRKKPIFYTWNTNVWDEQLGPSTTSDFGSQTRIDFYDYSHFLWSDTNGNIRKYSIPGTMDGNFANTTDGTRQYRNISGITGTDYFAVNKINTNSVFFKNGTTTRTQPIGADAVTNGIIKFRESSTDNKYYLMFEETNNDIVFQKYNTVLDTWRVLPNIGLSTTVTDFFVKMEMNPVDGNMYVLYKDGGKMSLKKFNIQVPLNLARIYIDTDATGSANGSSWADAFTTIQDAIVNIEASTTEFWIAEGTYLPHATDKTKSFMFDFDNLTVYGGFDGTETTLVDRDLNGDDTGVSSSGNNRDENSQTVVQILANGITLDGVSVNNGHATAASSLGSHSGGIYIADTTTSFTLKNCQVNKNVARAGAGIRFYSVNNATINIENCVFNNNLGRYATLYLLTFANNKTLDVAITNSLFTNNESKDFSGVGAGIAGSAAWIRAYTPGSTVTTTISNCTFANNNDIGTQSGSEQGTLALGRRTAGNSTHNATINNSIFYGNTGAGGVVTKSVNRGHVLLPNTVTVNNSIGEDNFSNLIYLTNITNANPLFTDVANDDFTLQTGSPAIDTGDNSKIPAGITADLLQNVRIHNTTVDMGCYEFGSGPTASINDVEKLGFIIYPNPVLSTLNIQVKDTNFKSATIYNLLGRKLLVSTTENINVSQLSKGIYLVKVTNTSGQISTKRFIKR